MRERWLAPSGVRLSEIDPDATPDAPGSKAETKAETKRLLDEARELHDKLWAHADRSILVVLQAMDSGGKDSTIKRVFGAFDPLGLRATSFGPPTSHELERDFLWRVHAAVPTGGQIGVFNRSHYEDVVTVRVLDLVPQDVWRERFGLIRGFEDLLHHSGTTVFKLFLHISKDEQRKRLQRRLDDPTKRWKFQHADIAQRRLWDEFEIAYEDAIDRTNTPSSPWYIVPANHRWYRDYIVASILTETLREMDPQYPAAPEIGEVKLD